MEVVAWQELCSDDDAIPTLCDPCYLLKLDHQEKECSKMDPDANLKEQREITERLQHPSNLEDREARVLETAQLMARFMSLAVALDEWISRGGSLPKAWLPGPECDSKRGDGQ